MRLNTHTHTHTLSMDFFLKAIYFLRTWRLVGVWLILVDITWAWLQILIWDHICSTCHSSSLGQDYLRHVLAMAKGKNVKGQVQPCKLTSCSSVMNIYQRKHKPSISWRGRGVYFITMRPWHGRGWPITQAIIFFPFYLASTAIDQEQ